MYLYMRMHMHTHEHIYVVVNADKVSWMKLYLRRCGFRPVAATHRGRSGETRVEENIQAV